MYPKKICSEKSGFFFKTFPVRVHVPCESFYSNIYLVPASHQFLIHTIILSESQVTLDSFLCIFCQMRQTIGLFIAFTATGINVNGEFMTRNGTFVDRNINYKP